MQLHLILLFFISLTLLCYADDISFVGGCKIKNVTILNKTKDILTIKTTDNRIISFENPKIIKITKREVYPHANSIFGGYNCLHIDPIYQAWEDQYIESFVDESDYNYPNLFMLPITFIALALTYDAIDNISEINDLIGEFEEFDEIIDASDPINKLKSKRTKYYVLGAVYLIAGVVNTTFAFEKVRVSPGKNGIKLTYNF